MMTTQRGRDRNATTWNATDNVANLTMINLEGRKENVIVMRKPLPGTQAELGDSWQREPQMGSNYKDAESKGCFHADTSLHTRRECPPMRTGSPIHTIVPQNATNNEQTPGPAQNGRLLGALLWSLT